MNLTAWLIIAAVVAALVVLKRVSLLSVDKARRFLREGAVVVDVRNPSEFDSGHLPEAINVPLGKLKTDAPRRMPDKSRVLLLHCLSGMRSGIAKGQLRRLGYSSVFNLGSYGRAEQIVRGGSKEL